MQVLCTTQSNVASAQVPCPDADATLSWIYPLKGGRDGQAESIGAIPAPSKFVSPCNQNHMNSGENPESSSSSPLNSSSKEIPTAAGTSTPTLCRAVAVFS